MGYAIAASVGLVLGMLIMYPRVGVNPEEVRKLQATLANSNTTVADLQRMLGLDPDTVGETTGREVAGKAALGQRRAEMAFVYPECPAAREGANL